MVIIHKKHILAGALGITLLTAGYINYINKPADVSGRITNNSPEAAFVSNIKKEIETAKKDNSQIGDAYFVSAKLEKEQTYDKQVAYHEEIMFNEKSDEAAKTMAQEQINKIVSNLSKEMAIEKLLQAKGFEEVLAIINDKDVNVIVKTMEELSVAQVAQIQNVVMREAEAAPENIHVVTKG